MLYDSQRHAAVPIISNRAVTLRRAFNKISKKPKWAGGNRRIIKKVGLTPFFQSFADGTAFGGWTAVDFGDNNFLPINDWKHNGKPMGTGYMNRYANSILTQAEFSAASAAYGAFRPGEGCYANPQCAGLRNPIHDAENFQAAKEFTEGFPVGVENRAKSYIDVPNYNFAPFPVNLFVTDSLNTRFGVQPWFNYTATKGPFQAVGATAGGLTLDIAAMWATRKAIGFASNPFSVRGGTGVFGRNGLRLGNLEINALYENPRAGGGTLISFKQKVQEGTLFRIEKGTIHNANRVGWHSTVRFTFNGTRYGNTAQRNWYPSFFAPPFFKSH